MREIFSEHTNEHLRSFVALVHAQASAGDSSEAAGKALSFGGISWTWTGCTCVVFWSQESGVTPLFPCLTLSLTKPVKFPG